MLACLTNSQAQFNLILFTEQGERFWLVLNGIRQNEDSETNVKVTGLNAPLYKAKIIFEDKTWVELDKNVYMPDYPAEVTYTVRKGKKGEYVLRYVSDIPLAQAHPPAPQQRVIALNTTSSPVVQHTGSITEHTTTPDTNVSAGMSVSAPNEQVYVLPGYSGPVGCPLPMNDLAFESAKASILAKSFEDSKLTIAKQFIDSTCLLSSQVEQVLTLFSFENSKLEFAKYAYHRTFDLGNYYTVNDAFTFESSIDELNSYINSQR